jgi:hypothetical protein
MPITHEVVSLPLQSWLLMNQRHNKDLILSGNYLSQFPAFTQPSEWAVM